MLEWIAVGVIVAVAALLLARSMYNAVSDDRPTCACGHMDCPLAGACSPEHDVRSQGRPEGCPLDAPQDGTEHEPTSVP